MAEEPIELKDVINQMETFEKFSIKFVTADRKKNKGGEIIEVDEAVKTGSGKSSTKTPESKSADPGKTVQKNPNHYQNDTINIIILSSNQKRKVHKRLITEFNGKKVIW